ncbi:uncharacterized protein B0H64DRAFT_405315 [Chaetomium fimeti]|uniref:F-box domain-containing protein n=1 Tax=Chaetomium fimeti TaxID=1854472 RepID=A0AAE0HBY9_9PEZI|nr:hypothetical protein B0H64DRAFT_405315 [Chaetomium fimeti]
MARFKRFIRSLFCLAQTRRQRYRDSSNISTTDGKEKPSLSTDGMSDEQSVLISDLGKNDIQQQDSHAIETELCSKSPTCPLYSPDGRPAKDTATEKATTLTKITPSKKSPEQTPVFPFPLEIFERIWAYLTPPESRMAFALASRFFFYHFKPGPLTTSQTQTLQLWLERDTPNLYFCWLCKRLHTWCCGELEFLREGEGRHPTRVLSFDKGCRFRKWSGHPASLGNAQNIKLETARLIMNRHFYGGEHGLGLDALCYRRQRLAAGQQGSSIMVEESRRLRVIDNELYVKEDVLMYHKDGHETALRDYLDAPGGEDILPPVCRHIGRYHRFGKSKATKPTPKAHAEFIGPILSCKYCYTDCHIVARWQAGDGARPAGWTVSGSKWYTLGSCRDLRNDKWNNAAIDFVRFHARPRAASPDCPAGIVRGKWLFGNRYGRKDVDVELVNETSHPIFVGSLG